MAVKLGKSRKGPVRVRKAVHELSGDELARLRRAFAAAQATDEQGYRQLAGIPGLPLPIKSQHGNDLFLPWNRACLASFEEMLQRFEPEVTLPVWDWTELREIPEAFDTPTVQGGDNPLRAASIDPDALTQAEERHPRATKRVPGGGGAGDLPTSEDIAGALAFGDFVSFSRAVESLSNYVHAWVGGDMATVGLCAHDPLYWAHRAMVDRIWASWQERHPSADVPAEIKKTPLDPFETTVNNVLQIDELGYAYSPADDLEDTRLLESGAESDLPAAEDRLGFQAYAAAFAEMIAAPATTPPLAVGIFASWGMGKSTLMQAIAREIEQGQGTTPPEDRKGEEPSGSAFVHIVSFNAWDYSAEEAIWPALARETMDTLQREVRWSRLRRGWEVFKWNLARTWRKQGARFVAGLVLLVATAAVALVGLGFDPKSVAIAAGGLGLAGFTKVAIDAFSNPATRWVGELFKGTSYGERLGYMEEIRRDLDFLVRQLNDRAKVERRVLVLIDDLDRCEPEKAVEVLHAVNRLLSFPCFIVCMGMDARVVIAAIENHYEGLLGEVGASGFEYLDKIVQIPFRIPEPDTDAIGEYVSTLLPTGSEGGDEAEIKAPIVVHHVTELEAEASSSASVVIRPLGKFEASEATLAETAPLGQRVAFRQVELDAFRAAVPLVRHNPRHVKRLINVYRLVRTIAEWKSRVPEEGEAEDARLILAKPTGTVRWIVAASQWPYTTGAMLNATWRLEENDKDGVLKRPDVLMGLYDHIKGDLAAATQERFDDEVAQFEKLLEDTPMTWNELRVIRDYTVNFNPAVTEQLRLEALRRQGGGPPFLSEGAGASERVAAGGPNGAPVPA